MKTRLLLFFLLFPALILASDDVDQRVNDLEARVTKLEALLESRGEESDFKALPKPAMEASSGLTLQAWDYSHTKS